jgi:hypothetical protein
MLAAHSFVEGLYMLGGSFCLGVGWSLGCWLVGRMPARKP